MAVPANTYVTREGVGIREDLADMIYDISPTDTPFLSAARRGTAKATAHEWQTDALDEADADNAHAEGDDSKAEAAAPTARLKNHTQIFKKAVQVSGSFQAVNAAGRRDELSYQLTKRSRELKRDIEARMTGNHASSAAATRKSAGVEAWLVTNTDRGADGDGGGYTAGGTVSAATDAADDDRREFTEDQLKAVVQSCWNEGGDPGVIMVGAFNKQKASGFSGIATLYRDTAGSRKPATIMGAADIYVSDFGEHRIVANRFSRDRTALVLDMAYWELAYLRGFRQEKLAKTGDSEKRHIVAELTLCSKNEAASGCVADLTTA